MHKRKHKHIKSECFPSSSHRKGSPLKTTGQVRLAGLIYIVVSWHSGDFGMFCWIGLHIVTLLLCPGSAILSPCAKVATTPSNVDNAIAPSPLRATADLNNNSACSYQSPPSCATFHNIDCKQMPALGNCCMITFSSGDAMHKSAHTR